MQWLSYVAYVRYGFEGSMLAIYGFDREPLECKDEFCVYRYPVKFLEVLGMEDGLYWLDVVCLLVFFVILRFLGYFVLKLKMNMDK